MLNVFFIFVLVASAFAALRFAQNLYNEEMELKARKN